MLQRRSCARATVEQEGAVLGFARRAATSPTTYDEYCPEKGMSSSRITSWRPVYAGAMVGRAAALLVALAWARTHDGFFSPNGGGGGVALAVEIPIVLGDHAIVTFRWRASDRRGRRTTPTVAAAARDVDDADADALSAAAARFCLAHSVDGAEGCAATIAAHAAPLGVLHAIVRAAAVGGADAVAPLEEGDDDGGDDDLAALFERFGDRSAAAALQDLILQVRVLKGDRDVSYHQSFGEASALWACGASGVRD